jgi:glycerol uptake facilitator-like aquaporin
MDEKTVLSIVFALSYSIATAFIIYLTDKRYIIFTYASADAIAVLLYYFPDIPLYLSAIYFFLYTFILIASVSFINKPESVESKVFRLKGKKTQKQIADDLGVTPMKVSRIINKKEG